MHREKNKRVLAEKLLLRTLMGPGAELGACVCILLLVRGCGEVNEGLGNESQVAPNAPCPQLSGRQSPRTFG